MDEKVTWFFTSHEMDNGFWHGTRIVRRDHLDRWRGNHHIPTYLSNEEKDAHCLMSRCYFKVFKGETNAYYKRV